jgi:hypothetical protein
VSDRRPKIGDILVVNDGHVGMIRSIKLDSRGYASNVYVAWQTESSWCYSPEHGYDGMNIHNLRHVYRIFRNGQEIK